MARIAGIDLPKNKRGIIGLTYIYGIGPKKSEEILAATEISGDKKIKDWSDDEVAAIRKYIEDNFKVEGALRSEMSSDIRRLMDIGCYRGLRHRKGLPVRGQRTKTNARTRKGKRRTIVNKKKAPKK